MVLHVRDAAGRARALLDEHNYHAGVFHCFSGDRKMAEWAVERGFYISFAGNLTYGDERLADVCQVIPHDRLMVETDAPFLAPQGHRGRRNEPAWVAVVGETLAALHEVPIEVMAEKTSENTRSFYRLP